jgi:hypothetical protein
VKEYVAPPIDTMAPVWKLAALPTYDGEYDMAGHAKASASAAERWMNCPGSVRLQPSGRVPSRAAAEGTFAHELAAGRLNGATLPLLGLRETVEGFTFVVDQEMVDAIETYVQAVADWNRDPWVRMVEIELTPKLKEIDPDLGGTGDFAAYRPTDKHLLVADFKYGAGTFVGEEDNRQLKIYALGALLTINRPIEKVTVMIVQPRYEGAEPVRTWTFDAFDLMDFMADLKDAAAKTRAPDAPTIAGPWCRKTFCAAAATCPAATAEAHALVKHQFNDVMQYDPQALSRALSMIPVVKEHIKQVEEFAYKQATMGAHIPGYKLVAKVARRQWAEPEIVIADWAQKLGVEPYEAVLKSPAQLEKGLTKQQKEELVTMCDAVSSGTTLVPEADRRPPVGPSVTVDDFSAVGGTDEPKQPRRLNIFDNQ